MPTAETSIVDFLSGRIDAIALDEVWATAFAVEPRSHGTEVRRLETSRLPEEFRLEPRYLVSLVTRVQDGTLSLRALDAICFAIEASDDFLWDTDTPEGERVARGLFLLGSPEVNYPLTATVLEQIAYYLQTGVDTLTRDDLRGKRGPTAIRNEWSRGA